MVDRWGDRLEDRRRRRVAFERLHIDQLSVLDDRFECAPMGAMYDFVQTVLQCRHCPALNAFVGCMPTGIYLVLLSCNLLAEINHGPVISCPDASFRLDDTVGARLLPQKFIFNRAE